MQNDSCEIKVMHVRPLARCVCVCVRVFLYFSHYERARTVLTAWCTCSWTHAYALCTDAHQPRENRHVSSVPVFSGSTLSRALVSFLPSYLCSRSTSRRAAALQQPQHQSGSCCCRSWTSRALQAIRFTLNFLSSYPVVNLGNGASGHSFSGASVQQRAWSRRRGGPCPLFSVRSRAISCGTP